MQQPGDIYHKETTPILVRRRRSSRRRSSHRSASRTSRSRTSKRRSRAAIRSTLTGILIWAALALVLVVYLGFLGYSYLKKDADTEAKTAMPVSSGSGTVTPHTTGTEKNDWPIDAQAVKQLVRQDNEVRQLKNRVAALIDDGQPQEALRKLEAATAQYPQDLQLKKMMVRQYVAQEKYTQAAPLIQKILQAQPEDTEAQELLLEVLMGGRRYEEVLVLTGWILKQNPYDMEVNDMAASAYLHLDKPGWALPYLRRVLAQNDEYFPALNKMAMAYLELGDYKKATDELTRMINMDKAESVTYYNLAVCYVRLQDPDAALNTLSHAADLYGRDFVLSWVKSNDFDSVRELEKFQAFIAALTEAPSPE